MRANLQLNLPVCPPTCRAGCAVPLVPGHSRIFDVFDAEENLKPIGKARQPGWLGRCRSEVSSVFRAAHEAAHKAPKAAADVPCLKAPLLVQVRALQGEFGLAKLRLKVGRVAGGPLHRTEELQACCAGRACAKQATCQSQPGCSRPPC